jgi:hypothetical protein
MFIMFCLACYAGLSAYGLLCRPLCLWPAMQASLPMACYAGLSAYGLLCRPLCLWPAMQASLPGCSGHYRRT